MVLTAAQMMAFFEGPNKMGITVLQLHIEGITYVADLMVIDFSALQQHADNLQCPGGRVPDPNPWEVAGTAYLHPPSFLELNHKKRIYILCDMIQYYSYTTVGCDLTKANLQWSMVMKNYKIQWKALKEQKMEDAPEVPKITKALPIIKWMEAFQDYLNQCIEDTTILLSYFIQDDPNAPAIILPLAVGLRHSAEHGSLKQS